jgi:hypothetical protein
MVPGTFNHITRRYPKRNHFLLTLVDQVSNKLESSEVRQGKILPRPYVHNRDRAALGFNERVCRHAEPPGHCAALVATELVKFRMDPALVLVLQDRVNEGAVGFVRLPQPHDRLSDLMRMG